MGRNYLKIALRTLRRQKGYAAINVGGLAVGIACCVLLLLYVRDEVAHDRFHENADRIVRINRIVGEQGAEKRSAGTPVKLAPALKEAFPEVEHAVRLSAADVSVEREADAVGLEALFADPAFFDVFSFPLLAGDPSRALAEPNGLVLSASTARRLFPGENSVGQALTLKLKDETLERRVTGVVADPPHASSIQFDVILPFEDYRYNFAGALRQFAFERWDFDVVSTFALLRRGANAEALAAKLPSLADAEAPEEAEGDGPRVRVFGPSKAGFAPQPLTEIHLEPDVMPQSALAPPSSPVYSYLLAAAALLILFIACVNFTTLAVGRSVGRAREVGVRKALGAQRAQVAGQFWGEALLTTTLALGVALGLARLFLPVFNRLAGKALTLDLAGEPLTLLALVGLAAGVALVAGSYPALVLSRFEPTRVLRAGAGGGPGGRRRLVRALVAVQFALSIALVTGAFVMHEQIGRLKTDLGFQQEQVVRMNLTGDTQEMAALFDPFREEARRHPAVEEVAGSTFSFFGSAITVPLVLGDTGRVEARVIPVTQSFAETLGIETVAGRGLRGPAGDAPSLGGEVLVNRTLARRLSFAPEEALDRTLTLDESAPMAGAFGESHVVGVVEDFHVRDLKHRLDPVILASAERLYGIGDFYARLAPGQLAEGLAHLRATWADVAPDRPFEYVFLDDLVAEAYETEARWRAIAGYAAGLALLIACVGLLGLAALAAEQRTKEIGIRKALGASVANIVGLLSADFLRLVAVGFVLGAPLAYLGARRWLDGFAYRIDLGPWLFLAAGAVVALAALGAAGWQAYRAALADPVQSLRHE